MPPSARSDDRIAIASTFADADALALGLTTSTGVMIAFFDRHYRIGWANLRFAEWFGVAACELVGRTLADVYGEREFSEAAPRLARALGGEHVRYERLLGKPGGAPKWISVSLHPHRDECGTVLGLFACSIEVDELKRTHDALDRSMQEIAIYLENSPLAVVEWDGEGRIRRWAGEAERVFGWTHAEVLGRSAEELSLVHPDWLAATGAAMRELRDGDALRHRLVTCNITRSGQTIHCEWFHSAFVDSTGANRSVLSLAEDITTRVEAEKLLRHAAIHDSLTGCHNRRYLISRIEQTLAAARRDRDTAALLFIDLDRFKPVNDRHGHAIGDALLKAVVERLRECTRESDCVARVGGDEFVVFMEDGGDAATAVQVRECIARRIAEPFLIDGHELGIGASIGIARFPDDGRNADQLLCHADKAMYGVKRGRAPR